MTITTDEVRFDSRDVRLAGSLTSPVVGRPRGSVLLLSGSGPQDRDEAMAGHRPFWVLAEHLSAAGYAVLRWDDRGVDGSTGDYLAATEDDLAEDVEAAAAFLTVATGHGSHALLGHSQGTLIATRVARRAPHRVAALVLLAGTGRPGREVLLRQHIAICEAEGLPADHVEESLAQKEALFDVLSGWQRRLDAGGDAVDAAEAVRRQLVTILSPERPGEDSEELREVVDDLMEWEWRFLLSVDPADDLAAVECPVLAMAGDRDTQVEAREELAAIGAALSRAPSTDVTVRVLADHNHLFQVCRSGAPSGYGDLGRPFSDDALRIVLDWLDARAPRP